MGGGRLTWNRAPEYKFPYAVNDCFDALKWVSDDRNITMYAGNSS